MADMSTGDQPLAANDSAAVGAELLWYVPAETELDAIRSYLRDIQAASEQLPELDSVADSLDVGFDPVWREGEA